MTWFRIKAAAGLILSATIVCSLMLPEAALSSPIEKTLEQLSDNIPPLNLTSPPQISPEAESYFKYYGIAYGDIAHYFGSFESSGYRIAAQVFIPEQAIGTVFLLHGYLDHTGLMKNIIRLLLDMQYSVAAFDLPGHGLSSGERAAINDFSEYAAILDDFINLVAPKLPAPQHLIGHSTGCAIIYEYLHVYPPCPVDRIIFIAPLVHSNHWWISKVVYQLADTLVDRIPRSFKENTSDRNYLAFLAKDPLQSRMIPLRWVKALYAWEDKVHGYPKIDGTLFIIQGELDTVVEWRYNIAFLKDKFSTVRIKMIPDAKHHLINENIDLRSLTFDEIRGYLKKG